MLSSTHDPLLGSVHPDENRIDARLVSYDDPKNFAELFRRYTGMSPHEQRRDYRTRA